MFTSKKIGKIFNVLEKNGIKGYGQSSWGPTSFIFCKNKSHRDETLKIIENEITTTEVNKVVETEGTKVTANRNVVVTPAEVEVFATVILDRSPANNLTQ